MVNSNVLFAYKNYADQATLSNAGGAEWALPLENMQDRLLALRARSANALTTNTTIRIVLDNDRTIQLCALNRHNLSVTAQVRVTAFDDAEFTSEIFTSGFINVWPSMYSTLGLEWEDDNYWDGRPTQEQRETYPSLFWTVFDTSVYTQYFQIEISDTPNPDGYIEVGRLLLSPIWQPEWNMEFGNTLGWSDETTEEKAVGGVKYFDINEKKRITQFAITGMSENEVLNKAYEMDRICGKHGEIFFSRNPISANAIHYTFVGHMTELSALQHQYFDGFSKGYALEELL